VSHLEIGEIMMSRGFVYALGTGARKSLVLLWTAVLLCSLLLQYAVAASPALAVHDDGVFQLDGNAIDDGAGDDWDNHPGADASVFVTDGVPEHSFTGGGSKDILNTDQWQHTQTSAPDKDDLLHAFAALYGDVIYFGADRFANNGDSAVGFWFFKNGISVKADGTFSPKHAVGDLFVVSHFVNGGAASEIELYEWVGSGGSSGALDLVASGQGCTQAPASDKACAIVNEVAAAAPWSYTPKTGPAGTFPANSFFEGGLDLAKVYGANSIPCFSGFLVETRSSQEPTATLKDFVAGNFDTCKPPKISTAVSAATINVGESVTDVADLTNNSPVPSGTIDFYLCGPSSTYPDCASGGTKLGATKTLSGGTATSEAFTPTTKADLGKYCFRAVYKPDDSASTHYIGGSHTNDTTECFRVIPADVKITKTAGQASVSAGSDITFSLSWGNVGEGKATGVVISDNLPGKAGLDWSIQSATGTGSTCSISGAAGAEVLTCNVGDIAGSTAASGSVTLVSGTTAASCGAVDNTGSITSANDGSGSSSASTQVLCPDIKVTKTPDNGAVNAGDTAIFSIKVENLGPGVATGVTVSDKLPAGLTWTENEADCSISGAPGSQVLSCNVGSLADGASKAYAVSAPTSKDNCGVINNTATAAATNEPSTKLENNSDDGKITVKCAQIDVTKTADAASVSAGDPIGFTISVKNTGDGTAYNVTASDSLNAKYAWSLAAPSAGWSLNGTTLTYSATDLAPGASSTVHVTAPTTAELCGKVPNSATASAANDGSDTATAETEVLCPDVSVVKTAVASPVSAGDPIAFDITVSNAGPGTAKAVTLTDTLPAGITWAEDSTACTITSGVLSCSFGDLAPNTPVTVRVSGTTSSAVCGTVHNVAVVGASNEPRGSLANNTDDADVVVNCPDVKVVKTADAGTVSAGDPVAFTIVVSNLGPGSAYGVTLDDPLPAGISGWSTSTAGCSITNGNLHCEIGTLAKDATRTVNVSGTSSKEACTVVPNTATVAATNEKANALANNQSTASVTVQCPDIKVTKDAANSPISAGDVASYTIKVENIGQGKAYGVTLTDTLPSKVTWTEGSDACSITGGVLSCDFGTILPGTSRTVVVSGETTAAACGTLPNIATASASNEPGNVLANNSDDATILVDCPQIVITKSTVTPLVSAGDQISFDVEVTNTGEGNAYAVSVSDPLPTTAGTSWTIDAANTTGAWSIVNGTLRFGPATLAPKASVKVRIVSGTTALSCTTIPNLANLTYQGGTGSDDSSLVVQCPDVTISKTADNSPILAGQTASYTISAWNLGPGTAYGVVITDKVPDGVAWTVDNDSCSIVDGTLTCKVGSLAKGDEPFTVKLSGPTARVNCGDLPNVAAVSATNEATGATGNNRDDASIAVLCPSASITKTNNAVGKQAPGATVGYTLTLGVVNGPIATMTVKDVLPANFGTPSAISDGGAYDAATRTITWTIADVANGKTLTYDVVIATTAQGGTYTNTATITDGPCAVACSDDSVVPVWRVAIDKSNNATKPLLEGADVVYILAFAVQNGPITSMVVTDTLPAQVVNPRNFSVAPASVVGQVITWNLKDVANGSTITYTASIAAGTVTGSYKNVAVITQGPCVDTECTDNSVVNTGQVEAATGTPTITPPPTDTLPSEPGQTGSSLLLILFAITGLVAALGVLTPAPARVRRQRRRG
jgi:uncharacterized repeat protein (TIGR01451 family)